jgi:hypothetical protein
MKKAKHDAFSSGMRGKEQAKPHGDRTEKKDPATPGDAEALSHASGAGAAPREKDGGAPKDPKGKGADVSSPAYPAYASGMRGSEKAPAHLSAVPGEIETTVQPGASTEDAHQNAHPTVQEDGEDYLVRVPKHHFGKK